MIRPRSLKGQFLFGSVLWTLGLLGASHMFFVLVSQHFPVILRLQHWVVVGTIALVFMLGGLSQVRRGITPINSLRARLAAVRDGRAARVEGDYPAEVEPLVRDLNALLEQHEEAVRRAQDEAGDLAHVLKTPLSVLVQDAAGAERAGLTDVAASMRHELQCMRRRIEYHLAKTRAAASAAMPGTRCLVAASVEPLVRTMRRLYAERGLTIDVAFMEGEAVAVERQDLDEMIGNLLDNACKWASGSVRISALRHASTIFISVEDDGPGLSGGERRTVLQRGVRRDASKPGSGLGLAIVQALAAQYGGVLMLEPATGHPGLAARVALPAAERPSERTAADTGSDVQPDTRAGLKPGA